MALSLLCGGLGVAEASVHVNENTGGAYEVLTKQEVTDELNKKVSTEVADLKYAKASDVVTNTGNIATNTANINKLDTEKLDKDVANSTFATKDALNNLTTTVNDKVDESVVEAALEGKADKADTLAGYGIKDAYTKGDVDNKLNEKADAAKLADYAKSADVYTKTDADGKFATSAALDTAKTDLEGKITTAKNELDGKIAANTTKINANETAINQLNTKAATTETTLTDLSGRMAAAESDIGTLKADVSTAKSDIGTLKADMTTAKSDIGTLKADVSTAKSDINSLKMKDTELTGKIEAEIANRITSDTALDNKIDAEIANRITSDTALDNKIDAEIANRITSDTALDNKIDTEIQDRKDAIKATNDRTGGIARNLEGTQTTIEGIVKVDNQGNVKDVKDLSAETITTTGDAAIGGALGVTGATTLDGALTANGEATFKDKVSVEKDLTVNGKLNVGEIYLENNKLEAATGKKHDSATAITADGISNLAKVTDKNGNTSESKFTHNEEGMFNYAKDEKITGDKNTHTYSQTAAETKEQLVNGDKSNFEKKTAEGNTISIKDKDAAGNPKSLTNKQTVDGEKTSVTNKDSSSTINQGADQIRYNVTSKDANKTSSSIEVKADGITNTSKDGTITNDAKDIVNNATGNMTNTVGGDLTTTVGGNELHEVTGTKTENVTGMVKENYSNGQETNVTGNQDIHVTGKQTNKIDGDQENTIGGDQTTTVTGDISNTAKNITNEATTKLTDKVGANTRVLDGEGITDTVGGSTLKSRVTQKKGSIEAVVTDGTSFNHSRDIANASAKTLTGYNKMNQLLDDLNSSTKTIKNEDGKTTKTEQTALDITNTAKDGTITNDAKDIVNNASGNMTNTVGGDLKTTVAGNELREVTGTKTENVTGKVTENYGNGQETNVTGDQYLHVTGKQTNKIDGDQENIIGGNQTTTVTGDISNKAENITNEANTKLTDKVGDHTRVLDSDGITDTVGGSTFKQRIDKIMMESKDVSIKAEETLTNEAKVITNKASEVINNEAVNINNTATGIITSKASEIKNQADKLISNKVGENTWENMENGKITTSIKDGAKQNLTQSDAAGTTQSTVDGGKSTVTIQNADGLTDAVTDGRNTSVQNQTASAIAADVKDGAGNENASVATATTSANTIKNGTKANTVISTADGTSFINSEAAAPVTGASGAGTAVNTTIKGNTITTGKVTMDYAEVMNDLGVHGSATVDNDLTVKGITTTKTLKVTENATVGGTLDVTKKATFHDDVDIAKNLSVGGNATIAGDVTARSYKVDGKTYIDANGINANDQKITNVADGSISEGSKDAVNGGQLYGVKRDLEHQVDKVGANAAAMANLRPMEFDPSSKWNIAAAIGNYGSETAAAIGAFYRPNDNVMVNLSTAFGTGENMVGGGVSVRLGKGGNKLSREETNALKAQVADLTARMDALLSVLNPNMSKDFPDVPENHWAYEAVSCLAGNDIVQGYPDGEFHGERTMTRYEMAEIIYNALSRGAEAEKELVEEFKPELQAMAASEKATAERAEG